MQTSWHTQYIATYSYIHQTLDSTQNEARRLIAQGEAEGALVMAETQTAGRGRWGRAWYSPRAENLYVSLILRPSHPLSLWSQYTMMAALGLADAVQMVSGLSVDLKWPNDLLIQSKKIAGILAEVEEMYLILGLGVNVNASVAERLPDATSLHEIAGRFIEREALLKAFVERFDAHYAASLQGQRFERLWAARLQTLGRVVRVRMGEQIIAGVAEDVTAEGALLVRRENGEGVICYAGDVTLAAS